MPDPSNPDPHSVPSPSVSAVDEHEAALLRQRLRQRLGRMAYWLDDLVGIPGTRFRVGLDAVIGLVPLVGDVAGLILGGYLLLEARAGGVPVEIQRKMLRNLLVEATVGIVPIVGDTFDVVFRANVRNRDLVEDWLRSFDPVRPRRRGLWFMRAVGLVLLLGVLWLFWDRLSV